MKRQQFTYTSLRYLHNRAAGETLNIGLVMYSPPSRFFAFRLEHNYKRLSDAFSDFDVDQHGRTIRALQSSLERFADTVIEPPLGSVEPPTDACAVMAQYWPDRYLSYTYDEAKCGLTADLPPMFTHLYDTLVLSQAPKDTTKTGNDSAIDP